jgi:hypothetical protein
MKFTFLNQTKAIKEEEPRWFNSCVSKNIPYVVTRKRSAYGYVEWDCFGMNKLDSEFTRTQNEFIYRELNDLIKYYWDSKTILNVGLLSGYVKNLPIASVEEFATDICNTLYEASQRHKLK